MGVLEMNVMCGFYRNLHTVTPHTPQFWTNG